MAAKTILIVEDDQDIRELLQEFLEANDYAVLTATNGQDALLALADPSCAPGLILLDRNMEGMDGSHFLDALEERSAGVAHPPVVMMSAAGTIEEKRAVAFLRKPFNFRELLEVVAAHCRESAFAAQ